MAATHPSVAQTPVYAFSTRASPLSSTFRRNRTTVSLSLCKLTFSKTTTTIALFLVLGAISGLAYEVQRTQGMCARAVLKTFAWYLTHIEIFSNFNPDPTQSRSWKQSELNFKTRIQNQSTMSSPITTTGTPTTTTASVSSPSAPAGSAGPGVSATTTSAGTTTTMTTGTSSSGIPPTTTPFSTPIGTTGAHHSTPLPSCLMPESFTGSGHFEDYLQQFNTAAFLSGWYSTTHDNRPHYFALRPRQNALHFFTTLSLAQRTDFTLLVDAFRQNYTTNVDILKARLKAARQQPNQDIHHSCVMCEHQRVEPTALFLISMSKLSSRVSSKDWVIPPSIGNSEKANHNSWWSPYHGYRAEFLPWIRERCPVNVQFSTRVICEPGFTNFFWITN